MSYDYIDSWKNLTENLPAKEELFSELNNDETPDKNSRSRKYQDLLSQ